MNDKEQLLADILAGQAGGDFARAAAAQARRRHAIRQAGLAAVVTLAVMAIGFMAMQPNRAPLASPALNPRPLVEIMSDQDLLAHLKDQPVLFLKNATGITDVVFLSGKSPGNPL